MASGIETMNFGAQLARPAKKEMRIVVDPRDGTWRLLRCNSYGADVVGHGHGWQSVEGPSGNSALRDLPRLQVPSAYDPGYCRAQIMRERMSNQTVCGAFSALASALAKQKKMRQVGRGFFTEQKDQRRNGVVQSANLTLFASAGGQWMAVVNHPERGDIGVIVSQGEKLSIKGSFQEPSGVIAQSSSGSETRRAAGFRLIADWATASALQSCEAMPPASQVLANGVIKSFNVYPANRPVVFLITGKLGGEWRLLFSVPRQNGTDNCALPVAQGSALGLADYSGSRLSAGSVKLSISDVGPAAFAASCKRIDILIAQQASATATRSADASWCSSKYVLEKTLAANRQFIAIGGPVAGPVTRRDGNIAIYANAASGEFSLVQFEANGAAVILAKGDRFTVAPAFLAPLQERTAGNEQLAEQRKREAEALRLAKERAAAETQRRAEAEQAERIRKLKAQAAAYDAQLAKRGQVNIVYANIRLGVTPIDISLPLFQNSLSRFQPQLRRRVGEGGLVHYCSQGNCIVEKGGKPVAITMYYGGANHQASGFNDAYYSFLNQGFVLLKKGNLYTPDVLRKQNYILTYTKGSVAEQREEVDSEGRPTGYKRDITRTDTARICVYPEELVPLLTSEELCKKI